MIWLFLKNALTTMHCFIHWYHFTLCFVVYWLTGYFSSGILFLSSNDWRLKYRNFYYESHRCTDYEMVFFVAFLAYSNASLIDGFVLCFELVFVCFAIKLGFKLNLVVFTSKEINAVYFLSTGISCVLSPNWFKDHCSN